MKPSQRYDWLEQAIRQQPGRSVDVLNRDFVDDYAAATGAKVVISPFGANWCDRLGRDLLAMKRAGLLKRNRVGIQGMAGMGFPRWVWSYRIPDTYSE